MDTLDTLDTSCIHSCIHEKFLYLYTKIGGMDTWIHDFIILDEN